MKPFHELVLASASPRRSDLLLEWGIPFRVIVPEVDEIFSPDLDPAQEAENLAVQKAEWVRDRHDPLQAVLAADTIVALGPLKLGKPLDHQDALRILMSLSGQELTVITGVALAERGQTTRVDSARTNLKMRSFDADEAWAYVQSAEPMGKAGAFAIQGLGGALIESRVGSFTNVVGLPRNLVFRLLRERQSDSR